MLIFLVCACPVCHCVICVYAIRSLDRNFPINTYLLTYLLASGVYEIIFRLAHSHKFYIVTHLKSQILAIPGYGPKSTDF